MNPQVSTFQVRCAQDLAPPRRPAQTGPMASVQIEASGYVLEAELLDTPAAKTIAASLPLSARMSRWGDEYYGSVGVDISQDDTAREVMAVGEIAYWPPGKALCIFFGRTPASTDERPRAASPVLPIGKITLGLEHLAGLGKSVGMEIRAS
jgi:hypothetical protein